MSVTDVLSEQQRNFDGGNAVKTGKEYYKPLHMDVSAHIDLGKSTSVPLND